MGSSESLVCQLEGEERRLTYVFIILTLRPLLECLRCFQI
jgi:hypothetical protein